MPMWILAEKRRSSFHHVHLSTSSSTPGFTASSSSDPQHPPHTHTHTSPLLFLHHKIRKPFSFFLKKSYACLSAYSQSPSSSFSFFPYLQPSLPPCLPLSFPLLCGVGAVSGICSDTHSGLRQQAGPFALKGSS